MCEAISQLLRRLQVIDAARKKEEEVAKRAQCACGPSARRDAGLTGWMQAHVGLHMTLSNFTHFADEDGKGLLYCVPFRAEVFAGCCQSATQPEWSAV